jgi:hypothetical protein
MGALDDYLSPCTEVPFEEPQSEKELMKPATTNGEGIALFTLFLSKDYFLEVLCWHTSSNVKLQNFNANK